MVKHYLQSSKVQKVLRKRPGDEGFSLIELVVVVAVLAVLSAIAIPSFTNISEKARATAAMNTVATIAKECATKIADAGSGTYNVPGLQAYNWYQAGAAKTVGASQACSSSVTISAVSTDLDRYPTFVYDQSTGAKTCSFNADTPAANRGCSNDTW